MGKRSDLVRRPRDFYPTPRAAVAPLLPHLPRSFKYCEPCAGAGDLIDALDAAGGRCLAAFDIAPASRLIGPRDARDLCADDLNGASLIITNPPWDRALLLPMLDAFRTCAPAWILLDADFAHTIRAAPYMERCSSIVSIGRVKWIPGSPYTGKDNCAWYRFDTGLCDARFFGRNAS